MQREGHNALADELMLIAKVREQHHVLIQNRTNAHEKAAMYPRDFQSVRYNHMAASN